MERQVLIKKKFNLKDITISVNDVSFVFLCCYVAMFFFQYIDIVPSALKSLMLYAFMGTALISILLKNKVAIGQHVIFYSFFLLICLISVLYSYSSSVSFSMSIDLIKVLIFIVLMYNVVESKEKIRAILMMYVCSSIVLFLYLLVTGQLNVDERLGSSLAGNANIFANIFMIAAWVTVYFIFFSTRKIMKIFSWIAFVSQEIALVLSGGRKNFLLPIAMIFAIVILKADKKGRKNVFTRMCIVAVLAILLFHALFEVPFLYDSIGYRMEGFLNLFSGQGEVDASTRIRSWMLAYGIELWFEHPIIGNGINTFKVFNPYGYYSHNNFVELLSCVGVLGFTVYYASYVNILYSCIKNVKKQFDGLYWIVLLLVVLFFEFGAVTYYMFEIQMLIVLTLRAQNNKDIEVLPS